MVHVARLAALSALLGVLAVSAQLLPYVPADSFDTLYDPPTFEEKLRQSTLLAELGSSFDGIRYLVTRGETLVPSLASFRALVPTNLTIEPGLSTIAYATQAYLALYGGVLNTLYPAFPNGPAGPINVFQHQAAFSTNVQLGNGATYYSYAAFSLVNGPLLLTIPPYNGGYWVIPFYTAYGEVFYSFGSRQGNNDGGQWLLAHKDWDGPVPQNATLVRCPTIEGNILGRTAFNGTGGGNWSLTWRLEPLPAARSPPPAGDVITYPAGLGFAYPATDTAALRAVDLTNPLAFWKMAGEVFRRNGGPSVPAPLVGHLERLGIYKQWGFIPYGLSDVTLSALAVAPYLANRILVAKYIFLGTPQTNYWKQPIQNGNWGNDYVLGAAIMKGFWISNFVSDAAYIYQYLDNTAAPLHGSFVYEVVFPSAPPATSGAFWSLQAYNLDFWTSLIGPYQGKPALSSNVPGLYVRPGGSIPIRIQSFEPPNGTTAASRGWNWVPSYNAHIMLVLRVYAGDSSVTSNTYVPPPVVRVGGEVAPNSPPQPPLNSRKPPPQWKP